MCPFYSCGCLKGSKRDQRDLWTPTKKRGLLKKSGPVRTTGNSPKDGQSSHSSGSLSTGVSNLKSGGKSSAARGWMRRYDCLMVTSATPAMSPISVEASHQVQQSGQTANHLPVLLLPWWSKKKRHPHEYGAQISHLSGSSSLQMPVRPCRWLLRPLRWGSCQAPGQAPPPSWRWTWPPSAPVWAAPGLSRSATWSRRWWWGPRWFPELSGSAWSTCQSLSWRSGRRRRFLYGVGNFIFSHCWTSPLNSTLFFKQDLAFSKNSEKGAFLPLITSDKSHTQG